MAALLAAIVCTPLAAQEGDDLDALFLTLREGTPAEAARAEREIFAAFARSGSDAMDLLLERGRAALESGDHDEAIGHFTALVDHAPEFPEGYNARATAYFMDGRYGPAIVDIERTLALEPRHFGALSGLAVILEELGYEAEALAAWHELKAIHPTRRGVDDTIARLELALEGTAL